ncbi:unnamed protein product [Phytomonas sp. EM1]|nr:unnamed protein product [Phytomonas sp. EM1]|eukprot:CCW64956.1 unnamed protein product [Phytomonas sp. isolate EM1]
MQHVEDFDSEGSQEQQYYAAYEDWSVHRAMLSDKPRMDFYRSILSDPDVVRGKVVADVGSGTGVLSVWAALAGAAHVVSLEASTMARAQSLVFEENAVVDRVSVIEMTVEALVVRGVDDFIERYSFVREAGGVALLVSEWMGFYLFHEGMLPSVLLARDFFNQVNNTLNHGITLKMIPSSAVIKAAPVSLRPYFEQVIQPFWNSVAGIRMGSVAHLAYEQAIQAASPMIDVIPPGCLLHEGEEVWSSDLSTLSASDIQCVNQKVRFEFMNSTVFKAKLKEDGVNVVDGFILWFEVGSESKCLSTSPAHPPTHWKQSVMLLPYAYRHERVVAFDTADDVFEVTFTFKTRDDNPRCYILAFELN